MRPPSVRALWTCAVAWRVAGKADGGDQPGGSGPGRPARHLRQTEARRSGCGRGRTAEESALDSDDEEAAAAIANATLAVWARRLWNARQRRAQAEAGTGEDDVSMDIGEAGYAGGEDSEEDGIVTGRSAKRFFVLHAMEMEAERRAQGIEPREERIRYMDSKFAIDLRGIRSSAVPSLPLPWPGFAPQVAFLFLAMRGLDFEKVWDNFFSGAQKGHFSIYVHRAALWRKGGAPPGNRSSSSSSSSSGAGPPPLSQWGAIDVPPVETGWCALMGVQVALLAAALQDARNQQFVFVSHNTVPLKGFDYVYRHLAVNSPLTSKFCLAEPAYYKLAAMETIWNELRRTCVFRDFYRDYNPRTLKHHQWVVLARAHAEAVVRTADKALHVWNEAWRTAAPDLVAYGEGCSDEAVPITALLHDMKERGRSTGNTWTDLVRLGVEQHCLTYVLWRHCMSDTELEQRAPLSHELSIVRRHGELRMLTDHAFDFFKSPLKRELNGYPSVFHRVPFAYLSKLVGQGFMFARKFAPDSEVDMDGRSVPLETALPGLWRGVDEEAASQRTWSRLSVEGEPRAV